VSVENGAPEPIRSFVFYSDQIEARKPINKIVADRISRCGSSCGGTKLGLQIPPCKKWHRGPCLEEGPALGRISRGWFWSLWDLFWCLCDAFRKSNSHSYSPLSLFLLASLWGLIVGQIGPKPALCSYSCLFLALGDRFWASDSTNAYFESSAFQ
jgi:hypothetical protein